jgi:hypothetical protein
MRRAALALAAISGLGCMTAQAANLQLCDRPPKLDATQQDRLLRVAAMVKQTLDASGRSVALVARAGLDLSRFNVRYSHAGISLKANANGPWSVRQLYYACDESRPRLFDQGIAGFLMGSESPSEGYLSIVLLPERAGAALEQTALSPRLALELLAADYSANAYAFSTRYQNCNQWVMELMASAWGHLDPSQPARAQAQAWLQAHGYAPEPVDVGSHALMFAAHFAPLIHVTDHPLADIQSLKLHISMPASIEAFARQQAPQAERIEFCYNAQQVVVRRGWQPLGAGCEAAPGDEVTLLN